MKKSIPMESASAFIDEKIKKLGGWRGKTLAKVRAIIHEADPDIVEAWKWRGTPTWYHGSIVCTGETLQERRQDDICQRSYVEGSFKVYSTPALMGMSRRAIDIHEGDKVDGRAALKDLIRSAVALNLSLKAAKSKPKPPRASSKRTG